MGVLQLDSAKLILSLLHPTSKDSAERMAVLVSILVVLLTRSTHLMHFGKKCCTLNKHTMMYRLNHGNPTFHRIRDTWKGAT